MMILSIKKKMRMVLIKGDMNGRMMKNNMTFWLLTVLTSLDFVC